MIRQTLVQGETIVTSDTGKEIQTLLGSCVSICLHDTARQVGGINHFLLPGLHHSDHRQMRYGLHAFEVLLNALLKLGANRQTLEAKIFGGAQALSRYDNVGAENARFAQELLQTEGIRVLASDVGGTQARKLRYRPATGEAMLQLIPRTDTAVIESEHSAARAIESFASTDEPEMW